MNLVRKILCSLAWPAFFHRVEIVETYDSQTRKLLCQDCGRYFAMSDRHHAVLPWDDDFEDLIKIQYGIARSKR